jgi:AraC-like DNA-binding protein
MTSLQAFADEASISVSHYSALFRQKTHNSPINYFIFLKIQNACQLLENTKLSVKQIGNELGYSDPFHFSRTFTKVVGVSPRAYRLR